MMWIRSFCSVLSALTSTIHPETSSRLIIVLYGVKDGGAIDILGWGSWALSVFVKCFT